MNHNSAGGAQIFRFILTPSIRARAVQLSKEHHLKLPDAIMCATAVEFGVEALDERYNDRESVGADLSLC